MTEMGSVQSAGRGLDDLRVHVLDGDLTLYDARSRQAVFLNRTATAAWGHADGSRSDGEIVALLAGEFGQEVDSIAAEVAQLLDDLDDLGLLQQRDPPQRRP